MFHPQPHIHTHAHAYTHTLTACCSNRHGALRGDKGTALCVGRPLKVALSERTGDLKDENGHTEGMEETGLRRVF